MLHTFLTAGLVSPFKAVSGSRNWLLPDTADPVRLAAGADSTSRFVEGVSVINFY